MNENRYKLLSLDLDGTLLMPDLTIPEEVCQSSGNYRIRGL